MVSDTRTRSYTISVRKTFVHVSAHCLTEPHELLCPCQRCAEVPNELDESTLRGPGDYELLYTAYDIFGRRTVTASVIALTSTIQATYYSVGRGTMLVLAVRIWQLNNVF